MPNPFYEECLYKKRLGWTGHLIPIRVLYKGVYVESFISVVPKYQEGGEVNVRLLVSALKVNTHYRVSMDKIFPTGRKLTSFGDPHYDLDEYEVPKLSIPPNPVRNLVRLFPGSKWTRPEVLNSYGVDDLDLGEIVKSGTKWCVIMGRELDAFTVEPEQIPADDSIERVHADYKDCTRCRLGKIRQKRRANIVIGTGPVPAKGMIIGESPWVMEEKDKIPLHPQAPAGGILTKAMQAAGLDRNEWYITNAVSCRPLVAPGESLSKNKPSDDDIMACSPRLKRILRLVSPRIVVLLGRHAYFAWFGVWPDNVLNSMGWCHPLEDGKPINYYTYFLCHPSYVARSVGSEKERDVKTDYLRRWLEIKERYETV